MKINASRPSAIIVALIVVLIMVIGRWGMNGFDFSAFFTAGTDFVDATQTPTPIAVQPGQGYDGQFFYRLALNPFDFSAVKYGVTFDFPSYRAQRIIYPLMVWLFTFGGTPQLVPFALVFVNVLAFGGIFYFVQKIAFWYNSNRMLAWYPLLIFGCYMTIAKDLSEVTELFFFTGAIWFMLSASWISYALFATLALLTRETALIALAPLTAMLFYKTRKENVFRVVYIVIPFVVFVMWKFYVNANTETTQIVEGTGNISWPFSGIYPGFITNFNFSSSKNIMQFFFWISYFVWQIWFVYLIITTIIKYYKSRIKYFNSFALIFFTWLLFALCLSPAIYIDDWSFVRVFALWNMIGMILLISANKSIGKWFLFFSAGMLALTLIRLIIKL